MTEPTLAELEAALFQAALIVRRNAKYAPIMDRLAQEVEAARERSSASDRAQRILDSLSLTLPSAGQAAFPTHTQARPAL